MAKGTKKGKRGISEKGQRKRENKLNETQPVSTMGTMFEPPVPKSNPSSKPKSRSSSMKKESPSASNSGKIKHSKNQYLNTGGVNADYKARSKGASSLMDMKNFKGGDFDHKKNQPMAFGASGKSNYRDRAMGGNDKI